MAVLNVRVDDHVRDRLKELADGEGMTISEYVRGLIMEGVVPVHEREVKHGEEPAPESMRIVDRQVLSLLHRILARVLPADANDVDGDREYQLMRAMILEEGFAGEYWYETAGFRTELSTRDCRRVLDILDMFRIITYSIDHLAREGSPVALSLTRELEFRGFDHNDTLESHMAAYVEFSMRNNHWAELKPQLERNDDGNSHFPSLATYSRMLAEYRRILDGRERGSFRPTDYLLSLDELQQLADSRIQTSHRRKAQG